MKGLLAGLALAALAGCSIGEDEAAAGSDVAAAAETPAQDNPLPEDATPGTVHKYLTSLTNPPQSGPWAPRDECVGEPGALEFREKLAEAVLARDADALVALASKDIKLDFGGGEGAAEFRRRLAEPDQYLWKALRNLMPLGCAAGSDGITIPWYFAQDIPVEDPYMGMVVRGMSVPMRAAPGAEAKIVRRLSWDAVELQGEPGTFAHVKALDGSTGYIETAKLRAIIDYRLIAAREAGGWKIAALLAGD